MKAVTDLKLKKRSQPSVFRDAGGIINRFSKNPQRKHFPFPAPSHVLLRPDLKERERGLWILGPLKRDEKREGRNGLKDECIRSDPTTFPSTIVLPVPKRGHGPCSNAKGANSIKKGNLSCDRSILMLHVSTIHHHQCRRRLLLYTLPLFPLTRSPQTDTIISNSVPSLSLFLARSAIEGNFPCVICM